MWPHRWQPTRLPRPWDSPGKNTGVACHFLLQCMKVKSESEVTQSCPTLSNPMDCSLPGSSLHGIFQARALEWGAIAFSFPCGLAGKECSCNAGDLGSIPELGRSPGEGKGYPLQYSGLENSMDCIVREVAKSQTRLRNFHFQIGHSFSSKEQVSFNFMPTVIICSDFGAPQNKVSHCFHCFPIPLPWNDGTGCHDLVLYSTQ